MNERYTWPYAPPSNDRGVAEDVELLLGDRRILRPSARLLLLEVRERVGVDEIVVEGVGEHVANDDRGARTGHHAATGLSRAEMAETLVPFPHTVEGHVNNLYDKLGVDSRQGLVGRVFLDEYLPEVVRQTPLTSRGRFDRV